MDRSPKYRVLWVFRVAGLAIAGLFAGTLVTACSTAGFNPGDPASGEYAQTLILRCLTFEICPAPRYPNNTDLNGDGFGDFIIGAPLNGGSGEGRAYLFYGKASTLAGGSATTADQILSGLGATDAVSAATLGDFNGDSFADLAVAAKSSDTPALNSGRVFIFYGGLAGIRSGGLAAADAVLNGPSGASLGSSLAAADFNGDGFHDLLLGAMDFSGNSGAVFIFNGSAAGIASGDHTSANTSITSENAGDGLGRFAHAQDVNGDGYADAIITAGDYPSAMQQGRVYLFHGGPNGIASGGAGSANATFTGSTGGDEFGLAPIAGDINGDGHIDLVTLDNTGVGYAYFGTASGHTSKTDAQANVAFNISGANSVAVGDLNQDGISDLLIGAPTFAASVGRVYYFSGRTTWAASINTGDATGNYDGLAGGDRFGHGMTVRNINNSGRSELLITANGRNTQTGEAYIFYDFAPAATNGSATNANTVIAGEGATNSFGNDIY